MAPPTVPGTPVRHPTPPTPIRSNLRRSNEFAMPAPTTAIPVFPDNVLCRPGPAAARPLSDGAWIMMRAVSILSMQGGFGLLEAASTRKMKKTFSQKDGAEGMELAQNGVRSYDSHRTGSYDATAADV